MKKVLFTLLILALMIGMAIPMAVPAAAAVVTGATVNVDFSGLAPGTSVTGLGTVNPYLDIEEPAVDGISGNPIVLEPTVTPETYGAPNPAYDGQTSIPNGGMNPSTWGFGDIGAANTQDLPKYRPNDFVFTFAPGVSVSSFSIRMLDYGDFNPSYATFHEMSLIALDSNGDQVGTASTLSFHTYSNAGVNPTSSYDPDYGNLLGSGDAVDATTGNTEPGNWLFTVSGIGITKVELVPGEGLDPNIGFDDISFTPQFPAEFVTGGGTVNTTPTSGIAGWKIAGNVGYLPDGTLKGNLNIIDFANNNHYVCHDAFDSLGFTGSSTTSPTVDYNEAILTGKFTDKNGETYTLTLTITDNHDSGAGADTVAITGLPGTVPYPTGSPEIVGGNFQVHNGYK